MQNQLEEVKMKKLNKMILLSLIIFGILSIVGSGGGRDGDDDSNPEQVASPQITPASDKYYSAQTITITCSTSGATIHYTTDGSDPSESAGTVITSGGTFSLTSPAIVKAIAYKSGATTSGITSVDYDFPQWTWVSGSDTPDEPGNYEQDQTNYPGARESSVSWTDSNGNLWFFGGYGYDAEGNSGSLNDLWKFNGVVWTWVSGDSVNGVSGVYDGGESDKPGARDWSASWKDIQGNLWLFGGYGLDVNGDEGDLNDLWKFEISSEKWTWVAGANIYDQPTIANVPGARDSAATWTDTNNNLWLFGGYGVDINGDYGNLSDLWKFDGSDWTLVAGSNARNQEGNYVSGETNYPGARYGSNSWIDLSGNLWLFGGSFYDEAGDYPYDYNDLWKFNPSTNQWTWISGSETPEEPGIYGIMGTSSTDNVPGARSYSISWMDSSGNLWLFGGTGYDSSESGAYGALNDLWKFNPLTGEWTWISGSNEADQPGAYGSKNTPSVANIPGARSYSISWTDSSGSLWLFGGLGYDSSDSARYGDLNDLWKFEP
jgi:N-acetylneuraminic acid mutarotase